MRDRPLSRHATKGPVVFAETCTGNRTANEQPYLGSIETMTKGIGLSPNLREWDTERNGPQDEEHNGCATRTTAADCGTIHEAGGAVSEMPHHNDEDTNRLVIETAEIGPEDMVLDVACGPGLITCAMANVARHVTGIDITPAMIDRPGKGSNRWG